MKNPDKTDGGELISSYACGINTVEAEFMLSKREYAHRTGRDVKDNDIIAYQVRQSFMPGEVTPEEANRIGFELAEKVTRGNHAFIVCTHIDRKHIHNHIVFNSTSLDCKSKYANRIGSAKDIRCFSDEICRNHGLSAIEEPKGHGKKYHRWSNTKSKTSERVLLKARIDKAVTESSDFSEVLRKMEEYGYTVIIGKDISFIRHGMKRGIRLSSLVDGYSDETLRRLVNDSYYNKQIYRVDRMIDISGVIESGKGEGYRRWAVKHNLQVMQETLAAMHEYGAEKYGELEDMIEKEKKKAEAMKSDIRRIDHRIAEIHEAKNNILSYAKTRAIYRGYVMSGYSNKYLAEHQEEISAHKKAKDYFDRHGKVSSAGLRDEYKQLMQRKKEAKDELFSLNYRIKALEVIRGNAENIIGAERKDTVRA